MARSDPLRVLLDVDMSSRGLVRIQTERGFDLLAAGLADELRQLDDPILFAVAQEQSRVMITHNSHDFPDILREWGDAGRSHAGCIISFLPTNDFGEMERRFARWFERYPAQADWIDRAVIL